MDWLKVSNKKLVFNRKDDSGVYQIYVIGSDGSEPTCLTCQRQSGGPRPDRHKGTPFWHPSGDFLVMQGEMASHWGLPFTKRQAEPGYGAWNDLYVTTPDGSRWYQLTKYSATREVEGVLIPRFSVDGTKLLWSKLVQKPDKAWYRKGSRGAKYPFGVWRLMMGEFRIRQGIPTLESVRDITPPDWSGLYESSGFSPDGKTILFTADIGLEKAYGMDIWAMDLESGRLRNLTNTPRAWEEHGSYSPSGAKISYMSSEPHPEFDVDDILTLRTELMVMSADGSDKQQITHFNEAGFLESTRERSLSASSTWSADGSQLVVTQVLAGPSYPKRRMWLITFRGKCG